MLWGGYVRELRRAKQNQMLKGSRSVNRSECHFLTRGTLRCVTDTKACAKQQLYSR